MALGIVEGEFVLDGVAADFDPLRQDRGRLARIDGSRGLKEPLPRQQLLDRGAEQVWEPPGYQRLRCERHLGQGCGRLPGRGFGRHWGLDRSFAFGRQ